MCVYEWVGLWVCLSVINGLLNRSTDWLQTWHAWWSRDIPGVILGHRELPQKQAKLGPHWAQMGQNLNVNRFWQMMALQNCWNCWLHMTDPEFWNSDTKQANMGPDLKQVNMGPHRAQMGQNINVNRFWQMMALRNCWNWRLLMTVPIFENSTQSRLIWGPRSGPT